MIIGPFVLEIILTFLVVAYLLQKYGNCRKHHILVTANVFIAWYFAFIIICILPLDVSSTAYRQCLRDNFGFPTSFPLVSPVTPINSSEVSNGTSADPNRSTQNSVEFQAILTPESTCLIPWSYVSDEVLQSLWRVVYWTAQTLTWIVLPMMQSYSTAGDFTISGKLKTALVENAIYYGSYLLIFGTLLIYVVLQPNSNLDGSHLKVICITASNTWGLFLLVLLEGYGLVEIPRRLWNTTKRGYMLNFLYFKASKVSAERCEAEERIDDLMEEITHISNTTPANHPTRSYIDLILEKLPDERKSVTQLRRSRDDAHFTIDGISVKGLAKLHKQIIRAIHMYRRTQCQWNMLLEQVFHWEDIVANESNREKIFKTSLKPTRIPLFKSIRTPKIDWYWYCMLRNWVYRTLCVVLSVFSAIVVWSELTFFTQKPTLSLFALFISSARENYNYIAIEVISTATIAYLCVCAYYTVFRIRILNYYYLAPHHQTNEYSLIFCGMLLCRLTPPLCLNFLGLIHLDSHVTKNSNIEETSYTKIMGHMDVIPIISDGFNIYFPILIFFVCLATYFNICSRILHFIGFEQFIGDDEMTSDLIEEGRELVKREKNRRQRLENKELRRRQTTRPGSGTSTRRSGTRDISMASSSPEENSRIELLKDVEPIDYTEERNHSPDDFGRPLHHEEYTGEDGNTYLRSSWSRIGRPPAGIFDDV
ncbi:g-protein coupled receptor-associated protein LMBRD2 [Trichonephila inaurata madagascariensis]|uniref:G-protein coupled receptor-associated protein LMBRD2 n=1 Tax=Trichonephila inaurata madagascariensis TaxID=2747483 RepID=A0A8X6X771_9ARAC|nr:g-protein coupled receptor-associated protein LMBRD2 [Trichonephila inaurata madagascariensis]